MHSSWKTKWVQALRSGKYIQGKGHLRKTNGVPKYCCLGVLCEIYPTVKWSGLSIASYKGTTSAARLPSGLQEFLGLRSLDVRQLIQMNDGLTGAYQSEKTFDQIADYIEERL